MNWKPTKRKIAFTLALAALCVVLEWFLSAPLLDPVSLGRAIVMGLVTGYLFSPWLASIQYPPGYFRPIPTRLMKALVIASIGELVVVAVGVVTYRPDLSVGGFLVGLLFIAGCVYVKLGSTTQSPSR